MAAKLKLISLDLVDPHPENPRIAPRDDVIDMIVAGLNGSYPMEHAVHVRPQGKRYQLISGHTRRIAAQKKGLAEIWAWVEDVDDAAAYMKLVLANAQGELDPLEIGIHAFGFVQKAGKGRGKTGGLRDYARQIGRTHQYIDQLHKAGEVFRSLENGKLTCHFREKAQHLFAIHKTDRRAWPLLAAALLEKKWSAADAAHYAGKVREFKIPSRWEFFLPYKAVIKRYLDTYEFSAETVNSLCEEATKTEELIESYGDKIDRAHYIRQFHDWLSSGSGPWDVRGIVAYRNQLKNDIEAAESQNQWLLGDWRQHVNALPNGHLAAVVTDPPYGMNYQSDFRLDRRQEKKHEEIANDTTDAPKEITESLRALHPKLQDDAHLFVFCHWSNETEIRAAVESAGYKVRGSIVWVKNNTGMGDPKTTFAPKHERILHAVKGSPILYHREPDVLEEARVATNDHPTEKPVELLGKLIKASTVAGDFVADPFGGVASSLVAAKECGRRYWGCELAEEYWKRGQERLES